MSLTNSPSWAYNPSTGFYNGVATQSLRFDNDSSAYLQRTPSSAANRQAFTVSCWVKRSNIGLQGIFEANHSKDNDTALLFENSHQLLFTDRPNDNRNIDIRTNRLFRDVGAWYHIVVRVDTTQSTASNRVRLYINGEQETSFATSSYPSQNYNVAYWNNTSSHRIGYMTGNVGNYYDGYIAEFNNVGSSQAPTAFGETKNDIWIPKQYSGSYGTNGFRLEFNGNGNDSSGNGNNFTTFNISSHDYVPDCPENNFATLNSSSIENSQVVLDEGGLNATAISGGSNWGNVFSTIRLPSSGKFYVECRQAVQSGSGNQGGIGVINKQFFKNENTNIVWDETYEEGFDGLNLSLFNNVLTAKSDGADNGTVSSLTASSYILMLAIDIDNGKIFGGQNGTWMNSADPAAGTGSIATRTFSLGDTIVVHESWNGSNDQEGTANFGQDSTFHGSVTAGGNADGNGVGDFKYTVPSGFLALCTANLPDPTGVDPNEDESVQDYFNTVAYTGNGSAGRSITGVGFQPDWVWIKGRNATWEHFLFDGVRGANKYLRTNSTGTEGSSGAGNEILSSFDSDGFSLATSSNNGNSNNNGSTYVSWNWKAGGTGASNTNGSITSTVSANTDLGFSIVSYTGTQAAATVGHGLSQAPTFIITKCRSSSNGWPCYHKYINIDNLSDAREYVIRLNANEAYTTAGASSIWWNNTDPTSTVFSLGANDESNKSGGTHIAYCFHDVEGFSSFGGYKGNGSTNGPFIYTGFKPAFVVFKSNSSGGHWFSQDNRRPSDQNPVDSNLYQNLVNAEVTNTPTSGLVVDFVSNGIKIRGSGAEANGNNTKYMYWAFAEQPFKYANAR
jgi:hypothetical protein